jgi:hypothetical protein
MQATLDRWREKGAVDVAVSLEALASLITEARLYRLHESRARTRRTTSARMTKAKTVTGPLTVETLNDHDND